MGGQRQRNRRNGHLDGDPVGLDVVQHLVDVEPAMQPDPRAGVECHDDVQQPEDVRRRRHDLHAIGRCQAEGVTPVPHGDGERPVGVPHRFGYTGRSGAEHEQRVRVGRRWLEGPFPRGDAVIQRQHRHQTREHGVIADGVRRLGHRERVLNFGFPPRGAQQDRRSAQPPDGSQRDHELGPVRRHQRNPVAYPDAAMLERRRHAVGQRVEF